MTSVIVETIETINVRKNDFEIIIKVIDVIKDSDEAKAMSFVLEMKEKKNWNPAEFVRIIAKHMYDNQYDDNKNNRLYWGTHLKENLDIEEDKDFEEWVYSNFYKRLTTDGKSNTVSRAGHFILHPTNEDDKRLSKNVDFRKSFAKAFFRNKHRYSDKEAGGKRASSSYYWLGDYQKTKIVFEEAQKIDRPNKTIEDNKILINNEKISVKLLENTKLLEIKECHIDTDRLPKTGFELVGRSKELDFLNEAWESKFINIVSLVAYGGVGKSCLINKWVKEFESDNYKGAQKIFAWSFYSQGTREPVVCADMFINEALLWFGDNNPDKGSPWEKGKRLAKLINNYKTLLILDGIEPLQARNQAERGKIKDTALSALVIELSKTNQGICIITTREEVQELKKYSKTTFQRNLDQISTQAAIDLLRIRRIIGTDEELQIIAEEFGNHALALNLLSQYLRLFKDRPLKIAKGIPDLNIPEEKGRHARRIVEAFAEYFGINSPEFQLLSIIGLFDRPAPIDAIDATIKKAYTQKFSNNLQDTIGSLWLNTLKRLRKLRLLFEESEHQPNIIDCHPLIREHFEEKQKLQNMRLWKSSHAILYQYYKNIPDEESPDTLKNMEPLFIAVSHGCKAGMHQDVLNDLYWNRIQRKDKYHSLRHIGAFGSTLATLSYFFEKKWEKPVKNISTFFIIDNFGTAGFILRALGEMFKAIQPIKEGINASIKNEQWDEAAVNSENLSEIYLIIGDIVAAIESAKNAKKYALLSNDSYRKMVSHTVFINAMYYYQVDEDYENMYVEAEKMQHQWNNEYKYLYSLRGFQFCDLLLSKGSYAEVLKRAKYTLSIAQSKGLLLQAALDNLSIGQALMQLTIENKTKEISEAEYYFNQAIEGIRSASRQDYLPRALIVRSKLFRYKEDFHQSWFDLDEANVISKECSMKLYLVDYHLESVRNIDRQLFINNYQVIEDSKILNLTKVDMQLRQKWHISEAEQIIKSSRFYRKKAELQELQANIAII